jgi:drug/metabolite transporter (DMT)-like permease
MDHRRASLLLVLVIVLWAGTCPLGRRALAHLGPITLTRARTLLAAPLLRFVARRIATLPRPLGHADYAAFVVLGLSGLVANTTEWYHGLKYTTVLNAGMVGACG